MNNEFLGVMKKAAAFKVVLDVISNDGIPLKVLNRLAEQLTRIQKALGEYLERQRTTRLKPRG